MSFCVRECVNRSESACTHLGKDNKGALTGALCGLLQKHTKPGVQLFLMLAGFCELISNQLVIN